ncbi:MAG: tRNA (adenosine(37)-N6)-threonylcarbamoyltransferase complex ATPase subunit type 1 TsaE [Candidatus Eisenbacteria bacterium]
MSAPERTTHSAADTERLGEALAPALVTGDLVALVGELGAGKTRFVTGMGRGLACRARVRSPSFAIVNEYHGRLLLLHLDLYRVETRDVDTLGLEEYRERGVVVVEWGDRLPAGHLADALVLTFVSHGGDTRWITATAGSGRGQELLGSWTRLETGASRGAGS